MTNGLSTSRHFMSREQFIGVSKTARSPRAKPRSLGKKPILNTLK